MLLEQAPAAPLAEQAHKLAYQLAEKLRNQNRQRSRRHGAEPATRVFALHRKVALMCLAEALLRIPDKATRDAPHPRQNQQR